MKKIATAVLALLLALVLLTAAVSCKKDDGTPEGMTNVATEKGQEFFDLFVPRGWIPQTDSGISGARVSNTDTSNVTATMYFPDSEMTAESYWNEKCLPAYQSGVMGDFSVIAEKCEDTTLGGKNAKRYVYVFTMDGKSYESMQIIAVHKNLVYTLTYLAESTVYESHLESVESIRANFRLK